MALRAAAHARVQVVAPSALVATAVAALRARGIDARVVAARGDSIASSGDARATESGELDDDVVAYALDAVPTAAATVELAARCARAAAAGRPPCVLVPPPTGTGRALAERTAALAYLRAHGAALGHDVDAWLEAIVALVRFGLPTGARAAVVAPSGSWLEAQALALAAEGDATGARRLALGGPEPTTRSDEDPTDVVLYDPSLGPAPARLGLAVPVVARGELADAHAPPALYGARAAVGAIELLGRAGERIAAGLGAAPAHPPDLAIDRALFDRELGAWRAGMRLGDHPTKTLLRAYGVPITRQVRALTATAAVAAARKVGFPVEVKPWGNDIPTELAGCPVERGIASASLVRRAYAVVLGAAGKLPTKSEVGAVIVRETPPLGRDLAISFLRLPELGWTALLDAPGARLAAAPAPLRAIDADALAAHVVASRANDPAPDRAGLATILVRASHLAVDLGDRLVRLELSRVVLAGRGARTVVVDAWCELA
jgi:hypothetical protein